MMVPARTAARPRSWSALGPEAKRKRLLEVATEVFTDEGLEAPMPRVAGAAGIGVGSLYRVFASKQDLIAAIVVEQMYALRAQIKAAREGEDPGAALEREIDRTVARQAASRLVKAALAATGDRREVQAARAEVHLAWQELLDRARNAGAVREDATVTDLRLVFAAARAADDLEPGARRRMLELVMPGLLGEAA